jgi:tetratricopeptide (TPR) repeat protein
VPSREQLDAVLVNRSGRLEETPYPILLLALALREKSARLMLRRSQLEKEILFDDGAPDECRSNIATETLGRFLVASGKLSESDRHTAFSESTARGVPLGEILIERKLLTPTELYRALQQNLGRKLLEPFSWKSGTYEISFDVPPVESALRVKVPQLIVTGIMKVETAEAAANAVKGAAGKFLAVATDPLFGTDSIRLSKDQQKVLDAAKRGVPFDEIRAKSGIDPEDLDRIVLALLLLGIVQIAARPVPYMPPFEAKKPAVAPSAPPAAPAPKPPAAATPAEEVMAAYLGYRRRDAFELLGVEENAGLLHIKEAFLRMADRFLPSKFDEQAADGLREKAQEVFLAAARAYAELADDERREALLRRRAKKREQEAAAAATAKGAMIDPDALCESGREAYAAGKLRDALGYFEMAADCDAQNGTYAAEVAWTRYRLNITPPSNALALLKNAIRIDPQSGVAYLYAGQVQAALGKRLEAEAYIERAATLMPKDPRPAEARKALR